MVAQERDLVAVRLGWRAGNGSEALWGLAAAVDSRLPWGQFRGLAPRALRGESQTSTTLHSRYVVCVMLFSVH